MKKLVSKTFLKRFINRNKKKIVLCHGVFDLVHYGHIMHFKSAKELGDILIVSLTKDKFVKKTINRPIFNISQRYQFLSEIEIIDYVYICETESASDSIKLIKPNFYVKGPDYKLNKNDNTKKIILEKKLVEKFKGKIVYTNDKKYSSSTIINKKKLSNFDLKQDEYINKIKIKYGYNYIREKIKGFEKLRVLLIGELIFDVYYFGKIIGKSGKEPHLVLKENKIETYIGGSGAIARHLSSFIKKIYLVSPFGNENFLKNVLNKHLKKNIFRNFLTPFKSYSSIIKKRFIDEVSNYKMFGSYILPKEINSKFYKKLNRKIKSKLSNTDMIIVCDYGHDFIDKENAQFISKIKKFKALNTQLNSSNIGFHSLNNYNNFDVVVINESELRQELKEENKDIKFLANFLMKKNKIKYLIITKGKNGASLFREDGISFHCPAFIDQSIDKVGAGDAMLSLVALALKKGLNPEIALFLGSIASAINVTNIGNKISIDYKELDSVVKYLLR